MIKLTGNTRMRIVLYGLVFVFAAGCEWGFMGPPEGDGSGEDTQDDSAGDTTGDNVVPDADDDDAGQDIPVDIPTDPVEDDAPGDPVPDSPLDVPPDLPGEEDLVTDPIEDPDEEEELPPPCTDGDFRCTDEGAEVCEGGDWSFIGACPLGCDEESESCYIASNGLADALDPDAGSLDLTDDGTNLFINTETGQIRNGIGTIIRPATAGYDAGTGTTFAVVEQGGEAPSIGVFSVGGFTLPAGTGLRAEGSNALAIVASGGMMICGVINVCARGQDPGPGGWAGGNAGDTGAGMCSGSPGETCTESCGHRCSAGGGGGGFGGTGGRGGNGIDVVLAGGEGGGPCGSPDISPLIGGSGGGGGGLYTPSDSFPGPGGGGGGAVQLVSALSIAFCDGGGIHAGGDGGGECDRAGGGGGGAGGAALIEAPDVDVAAGAIIASNGGGGGGGDCS